MTKDSHTNPEPKILVLGAVYETGNMGVDALLSGTIASILKTAPDATIKTLDYGRSAQVYEVPGPLGVHNLEPVLLRFSYKLQLSNNIFRIVFLAVLYRLLPVVTFRAYLEKTHPTLKEIIESDLCVSLAGGDSFSDIYGMRRLWYVSLPQITALLLGKRLVLLPQTLGPFKSILAKAVARFIMKRSECVYSRDRESLDHARELTNGSLNNLDFSRDMAFALEPQEPAIGTPYWLKNPETTVIGLNVSGLLQMGGYSQKNMFGLSLDYPASIEAIIKYFTIEQKLDLVLVTHVTGAPGGIESDATACQALFDNLKPICGDKLHLADPTYNHREIKHLIGKCSFFLGARMHACIAALSQGVPAVGMAYSRKFKGVFETLGVPELVVDLRSESGENALIRIGELFERRSELAKTLAETSKTAKQDAYRIFEKILGTSISPSQKPPDAIAGESLVRRENSSL